MLRDFAYAARSLRARPAFTAAAVVTLALGIGASTAMFSVANGVLLRPLPYQEPGRLVYVCADLTRRSVYDGLWSATDYLDLRDMAGPALAGAAAVNTFRASLLRDDGTPEDTAFANATPNIFRVLGLRVVLGRDFTDTDGLPEPAAADGAPPPPAQRLPVYAIVSYEYFQRHFGGNPAVLGKPIPGNNGPILIGVVERGAELLFRPDKNIERRPDIWLALRLSNTGPRVTLAWRVIARLRDGVSLKRAQSQADVVAAHSRALEPAYRGANLQFRVEPMQPYLVAPVRPAILALMGAVVFLLLIACSNVANLFLVRAALRARDLAVRTAMGASWWRLARQMLAEALLVAGAGAALGFGLAWAGMRELLAIAPGNLPRLDAARLDLPVLAFTIAAGAAAAVLFGLAPALRAANPDVAQVLRAAGRTSRLGGGAFARNSVVVAEVALCFVLLVGSALMFRSFLALQQIDPGFDAHHVLTFRAAAPGIARARNSEERAAMVRKMQAALAAIPGVESVTAASLMPLNGPFFPYRWGLEDAVADQSKFRAADTQIVLPGYFEVMRTPIVAGRGFNESDNNPDTPHVIIDQEMAAKAFPHQNAVGKRLLMRFRITPPEWYAVIGVVAHQRLSSLAEPGREQAYMTDGYFDHFRMQDWALRVHGDPYAYIAPLRAVMAKFNRGLLLTHVEPMEAIVERAEAGTRFSLMLIAAFAGIAALLAAVGLYGVLATVVRQRTAEIGVRMALGAAPSGIFAMMIVNGLRLSAAGIGLGLAAALLLTRAMTSMLVGTRPNDPATYAAMAALFFGIAALASWLPARRAAALDPSAALREE